MRANDMERLKQALNAAATAAARRAITSMPIYMVGSLTEKFLKGAAAGEVPADTAMKYIDESVEMVKRAFEPGGMLHPDTRVTASTCGCGGPNRECGEYLATITALAMDVERLKLKGEAGPMADIQLPALSSNEVH